MIKFYYNEKENILYINTNIIMCDIKGMSRKEMARAMFAHFKLSYEERINLSPYKDEILKEISKHPNCKISEFSSL